MLAPDARQATSSGESRRGRAECCCLAAEKTTAPISKSLTGAESEVSRLMLNDVWGIMPSTVRWLILRPTRFSVTRDRDGVAQVRFQHLDPTHVTT